MSLVAFVTELETLVTSFDTLVTGLGALVTGLETLFTSLDILVTNTEINKNNESHFIYTYRHLLPNVILFPLPARFYSCFQKALTF